MQSNELRKTIVSKKDYDRYVIPVSVNALFGKKRNSYLFTELGKRHPCFNNDFCIDYILKIQKKKFVFDVIVMNKLKYMEYIGRTNRFSLGLRFGKDLFAFRFIPKKTWVLFLFVVMSFAIFFAVIGDSKMSSSRNLNVGAEIGASKEAGYGNDEFRVESGIEAEGENLDFLYEKFLDVTREKKGSIKSFTWRYDGYFEELNCVVCDVFPEDYESVIENFQTNVEYSDGRSKFLVMAKKNVSRKFNSSVERKINLLEIRNELTKNQMFLTEEKTNPLTVSFSCEGNLSILKKLETVLEQMNLCVSEIRISVKENRRSGTQKGINGFESFVILLSFDENHFYSDGLSLEKIVEYESLFSNEKSSEKSVVKKVVSAPKVYLTQIGSIGYENGKKMVFYKDHDGKLIKTLED